MTFDQLNAVCDEILHSAENSATLLAMSDAELQDAYVGVLRQYGLELVCGAYEKSSWMGEVLVIAGNEGPIKACAAAFLAILIEMDRRGVDRPDVEEERRGVKNEERFYSGIDVAHGGTEYSLPHEAEAQHEEDGRSGKAEEAGGDSCTVAGGAEANDRDVKIFQGAPNLLVTFQCEFPKPTVGFLCVRQR
jgi:hypothetical protein